MAAATTLIVLAVPPRALVVSTSTLAVPTSIQVAIRTTSAASASTSEPKAVEVAFMTPVRYVLDWCHECHLYCLRRSCDPPAKIQKRIKMYEVIVPPTTA